MADNDNNKQRRLVEFKEGCRYGKFGKTKAYELIAEERIRAYKMGGKTLIDLDSIDEYHASLPRVESRATLGRFAQRHGSSLAQVVKTIGPMLHQAHAFVPIGRPRIRRAAA
jgi:excisionase family DNA binding protein